MDNTPATERGKERALWDKANRENRWGLIGLFGFCVGIILVYSMTAPPLPQPAPVKGVWEYSGPVLGLEVATDGAVLAHLPRADEGRPLEDAPQPIRLSMPAHQGAMGALYLSILQHAVVNKSQIRASLSRQDGGHYQVDALTLLPPK